MTETTKVEMLDDAALDAVAGGLPKPEAPHGNPRRSHGTVHDNHSEGAPVGPGPTMGQAYFSYGAATKG